MTDYYYIGSMPSYYSGLIPNRMFYYHPWPYRVPKGYYESIWCYQYLDDIGGLFPDLEVLLAVDQFSFLLGGAVTAGFSYYIGDLTEDLRLDWPPPVESWFEEWLQLKRFRVMCYVYSYLGMRYVARMILGGGAYLTVRHFTHQAWIKYFGLCVCRGHGTSFVAMWASGSIYTYLWTTFYTRDSHAENAVRGSWIGMGMAVLELIYGAFCESLPDTPNVNFI